MFGCRFAPRGLLDHLDQEPRIPAECGVSGALRPGSMEVGEGQVGKFPFHGSQNTH